MVVIANFVITIFEKRTKPIKRLFVIGNSPAHTSIFVLQLIMTGATCMTTGSSDDW